MRSLYDFIITPLDKRYNNTKIIENKEVIVNTSIETFKSISKLAKVVEVPYTWNFSIKVGDIICIHHNIFRRWYDVKGVERNSRSYFKDDLYFCGADQIYLYKTKDKWKSFMDRCFIIPLEKEPQKGIVKYGNTLLEKEGIKEGDVVSFKPDREFEFALDNTLLYCMKSKDIIIKHERKGNEKEYNPSWTNSSRGVDKSSERRNCRYRGGCVCGSSKKCCRNKETSNI